MRIRFWGARGSIPTPSTAEFVTSRYGGNTTCVSIHIPGQILILDGGSGLRNLGLALAGQMPIQAHLLFSHVHWDHIQGFPFFLPCFVPGNGIHVHGLPQARKTNSPHSLVENALRVQQRAINFPVPLSKLPAELFFSELKEGGSIVLGDPQSGLEVRFESLNHPGGCLGYRVEERGEGNRGVFVFATDTEHFEDRLNENLQRLARGAHVLVYDAQYTDDEYEGKEGFSHKGWGHSTWRAGLREAAAAGVKRLLLTHHDPMHDDWAIARLENEARREGLKLGIAVDAVREGMALDLPGK